MTTADTALGVDYAEIAPRRRYRFLRQLIHKKIAVLAIVYLTIFYSLAILAPFLPLEPYDTNITVEGRYQSPSSEHWLGTDAVGRDMLSRVIYAARTTTIFTLVVLLTGGLFLGIGLGLLAGYRGGWIDTTVMRVGEVLQGMPTLIIILAITAAFRTRIDDLEFRLKENTFLGDDAELVVQFSIIILATIPFAWIGTSRIVRSQVFAMREQDFITAAEMTGASTWRVLRYHLLPGVMPLVMVGFSGAMAGIAGAEVALSFLGLGISPPTPSFGNLISDGAGVRLFSQYPHMLLAAAVPLVLFSFAWNLLGDALVDLLEPRTSAR